MKYVFGVIGVIAALLFVGYSAVIAYHVAFKMNSEFQNYAGWAAVGMVVWGSIGFLFAHYLWKHTPRFTFLAIVCVALTVAAEIYITRLDLRFQVGGQADVTAVRADVNAKNSDTKGELDKARARRDLLQAKRSLSDEELDDLDDAKKRISALEGEWKTMTVNAGGMAEAAWLSRWGKDEQWWETMLIVIGLIFWPLARMFALPIAIASMYGVIRTPEEARTAGGETGGYLAPSAVASPAPRPRLDALTKIAGVSAADHVPDVTKMVPEQFAVSAKTPTVSTLENLPQIGSNSPNLEPDGPGTPVNLPENPDGSTEEATEPTNVVPLRSDHPTKAEMRIDRRANENSVSRWLRDSTQIVSADNKGQPAHKLIGSYLSYCRQRGETPLSKRKFSTVLRGELDLPKLRGVDGKRKSAVMMFPLQLVTQNAKRRVA